jgi:hypothetical protein
MRAAPLGLGSLQTYRMRGTTFFVVAPVRAVSLRLAKPVMCTNLLSLATDLIVGFMLALPG